MISPKCRANPSKLFPNTPKNMGPGEKPITEQDAEEKEELYEDDVTQITEDTNPEAEETTKKIKRLPRTTSRRSMSQTNWALPKN